MRSDKRHEIAARWASDKKREAEKTLYHWTREWRAVGIYAPWVPRTSWWSDSREEFIVALVELLLPPLEVFSLPELWSFCSSGETVGKSSTTSLILPTTMTKTTSKASHAGSQAEKPPKNHNSKRHPNCQAIHWVAQFFASHLPERSLSLGSARPKCLEIKTARGGVRRKTILNFVDADGKKTGTRDEN